jgi:Zn-finger protein
MLVVLSAGEFFEEEHINASYTDGQQSWECFPCVHIHQRQVASVFLGCTAYCLMMILCAIVDN